MWWRGSSMCHCHIHRDACTAWLQLRTARWMMFKMMVRALISCKLMMTSRWRQVAANGGWISDFFYGVESCTSFDNLVRTGLVGAVLSACLLGHAARALHGSFVGLVDVALSTQPIGRAAYSVLTSAAQETDDVLGVARHRDLLEHRVHGGRWNHLQQNERQRWRLT